MLSGELFNSRFSRLVTTQPDERLIYIVMDTSDPQILRNDCLCIYLGSLCKQGLVDNSRQAKIPIFESLLFTFGDLDEPLNGSCVGVLQMAKVKQFPDNRQPLDSN
jgi:hypothetical protein